MAPLVILTVPNAINDFFPSFAMGPLSDRGASYFSFITHLDVFFICALIRYFPVKGIRSHGLVCLVIPVIAIYYILSYVLAWRESELSLGAMLYGSFHIRYMLLSVTLLLIIKPTKEYLAFFIYGLFLSSLLVLVESLLYTVIRLDPSVVKGVTSGNFGTNVYGNLMSALAVSCYAQYVGNINFIKNRSLLFTLAIILTISSFLTATKMSALSMLAGIILFHLFTSFKSLPNKLFVVLCFLFILGSPVNIVKLQHISNYLSDVSDVSDVQRGVEPGLSDHSELRVTKETSSISTRLILWKGTIAMLNDSPWLGGGIGQWNYAKEAYGIEFRVLLDPHNDYLHFFVDYGIPLGLMFIIFVYIAPFVVAMLIRSKNRDYISQIIPFLLIPVVLGFSSLSNSNGHKHQVFMLMALLVVLFTSYSMSLLKQKDR